MVVKTKSRTRILPWNCTAYNSKKSRFIKEQEVSEILSSLSKSLSKIPLKFFKIIDCVKW